MSVFLPELSAVNSVVYDQIRNSAGIVLPQLLAKEMTKAQVAYVSTESVAQNGVRLLEALKEQNRRNLPPRPPMTQPTGVWALVRE